MGPSYSKRVYRRRLPSPQPSAGQSVVVRDRRLEGTLSPVQILPSNHILIVGSMAPPIIRCGWTLYIDLLHTSLGMI